MIILKIDSDKAKEFAKLIDTDLRKYKGISTKLNIWITSNPNDPDLDIIEYIYKNIYSIITEEPKGLESIIEEFIKKGYQARIYDNQKNKLNSIGNTILELFDYKSFRKSRKAIWFAKACHIKSCSTCNTQYTLITEGKEKLLFHLDHYFPKSIYPYLCLSYFNLLPCCASCNMSKSNKAFKLSENIHPYIDSFDEIARFNIDKTSVLDYFIDPSKNENLIKYPVEIRLKYFGNSEYEIKLNNYLREFKIEEQYSQFKDVASEICLKSRYYNKNRRNELEEFFDKSISITPDIIQRLLIGNYQEDSKLLNRPLAKFMKDISEDLFK